MSNLWQVCPTTGCSKSLGKSSLRRKNLRLEREGCARKPVTLKEVIFTLSHLSVRSSRKEPGRIVFVIGDDDAPRPYITYQALMVARKLNWKVMHRHKEGKESEIIAVR